jgi:hypothetical protein
MPIHKNKIRQYHDKRESRAFSRKKKESFYSLVQVFGQAGCRPITGESFQHNQPTTT